MDTENKFASCFGWVVAFLGAGMVSVFVDGWALSTIWNWFIPPIFHLVNLSLMQAVGVAMVFSLFTRTNKLHNTDDSKKASSWEKLLEAFMVPVLTALLNVGIAWVVLQFAF